MRADEQYPGDYYALTLMHLLKRLNDNGDHAGFANALGGLWDLVKKTIPEDARTQAPYLVLDAYFATAGDLTQWLREADTEMERRVGYDAHRAALDRMKPTLELSVKLLKLVGSSK